MRFITLITTGGTIEKTYDERTGSLLNRQSIVRRMLARLRLEDITIKTVEVLSKDSLDMTEDDRTVILNAVKTAGGFAGRGTGIDGIVILHGTDTLCVTAERICAVGGGPGKTGPSVPIVLTGAMRPFEMKRSDALQNLTEALFAATHLLPGVYCVAHGRALAFPGVRKDHERGTFVPADSAAVP